jgi:hypothetical protein
MGEKMKIGIDVRMRFWMDNKELITDLHRFTQIFLVGFYKRNNHVFDAAPKGADYFVCKKLLYNCLFERFNHGD